MSAFKPPTTDQEWAAYLSGSHDLDDHSLALGLRLVERLKQRQRLNPREEELFQLLLARNAVELDYLKDVQRVGYAVADERPVWPRWHCRKNSKSFTKGLFAMDKGCSERTDY